VASVLGCLDVDAAGPAPDAGGQDLPAARGERVDGALDGVPVFLLDQDHELDRHVLGDRFAGALRELCSPGLGRIEGMTNLDGSMR